MVNIRLIGRDDMGIGFMIQPKEMLATNQAAEERIIAAHKYENQIRAGGSGVE